MLKLTDAATLKPCYVFEEVTGVQPMLASTAGVVPRGLVATTRVWFGCACVDVRESVDEVIGLLAAERSRAMESSHGRSGTTYVCDGDDPTKPCDDVMVPAWLHNRVTGMAKAITDILDLANDCKPGEASAWSLDDPEAVVRMVCERMVRRDEALVDGATHKTLGGYEKMRQALDDIWSLIMGVGTDRWHKPQDVIDEVLHLVGTNDDLDARTKADGHAGCTTCSTPTCLHDNGCAHGHVANDVPAATEREPVLHDITVEEAALAATYERNARPGCYTTEPVSAHACKGYGDTRCDGCTGLATEADPFVGVDVGANGARVEAEPVLPDCDDGEPPVLTLQASEIARGLSDHASTVVKLLADCGPQTELRILGSVVGEMDRGDFNRVGVSGLENEKARAFQATWSVLEDWQAFQAPGVNALVQSVDPLPHDVGKPLMDRWTLTALGREVARVLARA